MNNTILIAKNVRLTFRTTAQAIYVSSSGEVILSVKHFGPKIQIPELTTDYLESLCSEFYFGGLNHKHAIADILLLNSYITTARYGEFYKNLELNLMHQKMTIISAELSQ